MLDMRSFTARSSAVFLNLLLILTLFGWTEGNSTRPPKELYRPYFEVHSDRCDKEIILRRINATQFSGLRSSVQLGSAVLVFLLAGLLSALIAYAFHMVRTIVYKDANNLDTTFDAGGKVSIGLTATTIVSQGTWSMTLLYPSVNSVKYGISGPYWYAVPCCVQFILFSLLSMHLKTRAPGAKTFLQVIKARFGKIAHLLFCGFALLTNTMVTVCLVVGSCAVLSNLINGMTQELCIFLLAAVIGCYTLIGGLGATFYVCYFNTAVVFIGILSLVVEVYYNPYDHKENIFGSIESVYQYVSCLETPESNSQHSYLTFRSDSWVYVGVIVLIGCMGGVFCDQSYWQSSVAAKPIQGVWGFILAGLTFICIPLAMGNTMGLAYLGMTSAQGEPMLSTDAINAGLVVPTVSQLMLGRYGEYLTIILILMAAMSTGSAEVIAVASVIIYDIYQIYVQPFRSNAKEGHCILCQKPYFQDSEKNQSSNLCNCSSMASCKPCNQDTLERKVCKMLVKPHYTCAVHGKYREYMDCLLNYKNWCIVWTTILIIPLHLVCYTINLNLAWCFTCFGILTTSAAFPIIFSVTWSRVNNKGIICGLLGGFICGVSSWLAVASTYPGGLSLFFKNTGSDIPVLVGNATCLLSGGIWCFIVTMMTSRTMTDAEIEAEWEKTRNIDNPLMPWTEVYEKDLGIEKKEKYHERPSVAEVAKKFRSAKIVALSAWAFLFVMLIFVWPGSMAAVDVLTKDGFTVWTYVSILWTVIFSAFIIIVPIVQEIWSIYSKVQSRKQCS